MNAALGGLHAFDVWSNNISGPGGLVLQGSGTLILAGDNTYTGDTIVQGGTLGLTGALAGNLEVWPGGSFAGNGVIGGSLLLLAGSTYQAAVGPGGATLMRVGGAATLSGGTIAVSSVGSTPALGVAWPILTAAASVSGSFAALTEPAGGLAPGTRFDLLYGRNTISVSVTPSRYADLVAAGLVQSRSERAVGSALDAVRLAPGLAMDPARQAVFGPLYILPATSIATGLDELAPSIYPDAIITQRGAWYMMADAVGARLAAQRGLFAADRSTDAVPGPDSSTIWVSGLGGYGSVGAGDDPPGFSAGLGGMAAGIDFPVAATGRAGIAVGTVEGRTSSRVGGDATSSTAQLVAYGLWRDGMFFAEGQVGLMHLQENVHRSLPLFGAATRGDTGGLAAGGGLRVGLQQALGEWLIEPNLGFSGFQMHAGDVTESGAALAETIGGATLGSAQSTLAVNVQRAFAVGEAVRLTTRGRLGWSHEFADTAARVSAAFASLPGSGFGLDSAPIGRDAGLVGLAADVNVRSWPVTVQVGYDGAFSGASKAQSFRAGVRFVW
jgi:outer membrane autotransporter protein